MSDYCDAPRWFRVEEPVARKEHACCECAAKILAGEKYVRVNACWDGGPETMKQHLLCATACRLVRDEGFNDDECLDFGYLREWWREEVRYRRGVYPEGELPARRKLWRMILGIERRQNKGISIRPGAARA